MALPKLQDQAAYYSRQLTVYNFTMVFESSRSTLNPDNAFQYIWTELERPKGSNEIASAVYHRLCATEWPSNTQSIRLVADGCGGQNKNVNMIGMLSKWLTSKSPKHITNIELVFPVTGHSFLPADRVFARIEKKVKAKSAIVDLEEYIEIYKEHGQMLRLGTAECPVFDWKKSVGEEFEIPGKWHFKFNQSKWFILKRGLSLIHI